MHSIVLKELSQSYLLRLSKDTHRVSCRTSREVKRRRVRRSVANMAGVLIDTLPHPLRRRRQQEAGHGTLLLPEIPTRREFAARGTTEVTRDESSDTRSRRLNL